MDSVLQARRAGTALSLGKPVRLNPERVSQHSLGSMRSNAPQVRHVIALRTLNGFHSPTIERQYLCRIPLGNAVKYFICRKTLEFRANGPQCDSPGQRPGLLHIRDRKALKGRDIHRFNSALSGLNWIYRCLSWGVAPGYHMMPRCGQVAGIRTQF
jgi:hypothetical protein